MCGISHTSFLLLAVKLPNEPAYVRRRCLALFQRQEMDRTGHVDQHCRPPNSCWEAAPSDRPSPQYQIFRVSLRPTVFHVQ